jgi:hypothetical protein
MRNIALIFLSGIMVGIMSSCSPTFHLEKFYKKGGKIEQVEKTVTIKEVVTIDGKDSIIYRTVNVECPEPIIKPRWKTRFDNKRFKDSLNSVRIEYKDSLRYALRTHKNELKTEVKTVKSNDKTERTTTRQENKRSWWLFWLGLAVGVIIMLSVKLMSKYLKTALLK